MLYPYRYLVLIFALFSSASIRLIHSSHISFSPPDEAFLLFHSNQNTNFTSLFVQDGCPESRSLRATIYSADQSDSRRIFEEIPLHCVAKVRIVTERVDMHRPYVDVLAVLEDSLASHVGNVCVHVQLTSATSSNELGKCVLNSRDESTQTSCVIRIPVPFSWFPDDESNRTNLLSVSYTISEKCDLRFHDLPQHLIEISSRLPKQKIDVLAESKNLSITLRSASNQSYTQNSMQSMFLNIRGDVIRNESIEIRLWIDSRLRIEAIYPLAISVKSNWTIRVSSARRPFFYTSIICSPTTSLTNFNGNIVALLVKMTSSSTAATIKEDLVLHWHVLFNSSSTSSIGDNDDPIQNHHKVATKFGVVGDEIAAVVVVPKRDEIMNTAVMSSQQVTTSMRIFTISIGAKPDDVTATSHCISSDAKILKTSPTCTSVYVDGSESSGSSDVLIYAHYLRYTTSFSFRVWYPKLPLTIWTSSSTLYTIRDWKVGVWRDLSTPLASSSSTVSSAFITNTTSDESMSSSINGGRRRIKKAKRSRSSARQFSCANRYQQSEIRVLASMWLEDKKTGDQHYLSSHKNIQFDVTNICHNTLHIANRSIAQIRFRHGAALIIGQRMGRTRIVVRNVKRSSSDELASEHILVHSEPVQISGLSARPVCHVYLRVLPILFSPAFFRVDVAYSTTINRLYQQCSIDSTVSYSDGTWESLNNVDGQYFEMSAQSNDDRSLAVSHHSSSIHLIAIADHPHQPLPSIEISIFVAAQCSSIPSMPSTPLAVTILTIPMILNPLDDVADVFNSTMTSSIDDGLLQNADDERRAEALPSVPMHIFLLTIFVLIAAFLLLTFVRRSAAFKGYEQLVAPLLSRLSSTSGSQARHEDTNEWVWLSQPQPPSSTLGSDYSSDKSSSSFQRHLSASDANRTSISYHGSEISVFIAPSQANVVVNPTMPTSRHAIVDSNSDHNLARWHSANDPQFHTWTWKHRDRLLNGSAPIRESVA